MGVLGVLDRAAVHGEIPDVSGFYACVAAVAAVVCAADNLYILIIIARDAAVEFIVVAHMDQIVGPLPLHGDAPHVKSYIAQELYPAVDLIGARRDFDGADLSVLLGQGGCLLYRLVDSLGESSVMIDRAFCYLQCQVILAGGQGRGGKCRAYQG